MMKNRDTASNPYRIPKQPTPTWIKATITALFLSNLALIAGFVMLVLPNGPCSNACNILNSTSPKPQIDKYDPSAERIQNEVGAMPRDWPQYGVIDELKTTVLSFSERLYGLAHHLNKAEVRIKELELCCKSNARQSTINTMPAFTRSSFRTDNTELGEQLADMKVEVTSLERKVRAIEEKSVKKCDDVSHYRHGSNCYYKVEARISQNKAKQLCHSIMRLNGVLAVLKDDFLKDLISSMLQNYDTTYWVGVERSEEGTSLHHNRPFRYLDGNKVQNEVWEMWVPGHRRQENCVAMTYDAVEEGWYWKSYNCSQGFGYVCQYEAPDSR